MTTQNEDRNRKTQNMDIRGRETQDMGTQVWHYLPLLWRALWRPPGIGEPDGRPPGRHLFRDPRRSRAHPGRHSQEFGAAVHGSPRPAIHGRSTPPLQGSPKSAILGKSQPAVHSSLKHAAVCCSLKSAVHGESQPTVLGSPKPVADSSPPAASKFLWIQSTHYGQECRAMSPELWFLSLVVPTGKCYSSCHVGLVQWDSSGAGESSCVGYGGHSQPPPLLSLK